MSIRSESLYIFWKTSNEKDYHRICTKYLALATPLERIINRTHATRVLIEYLEEKSQLRIRVLKVNSRNPKNFVVPIEDEFVILNNKYGKVKFHPDNIYNFRSYRESMFLLSAKILNSSPVPTRYY